MKPTALTCISCGQEFVRSGTRGPIPSRCIDCRAERQRAALRSSAAKRRAADPDGERAKQREWRAANIEKARAQERRRHAKHREARLEANRKWRAANLERSREIAKEAARRRKEADPEAFNAKRAAMQRARRERDPEVRRQAVAATRRWQIANPDKVRDVARRRRALEFAATVEVFASAEVFERDGWVCQLCGAPVDPSLRAPSPLSASLDHIVPLSRGGAHSRANTQLAHLLCNVKKGNRA